MKKLLTAALIIISLMLMLASCDSISDIIGGNDEPEITVSDDGYLVVDGVKTEHKVDKDATVTLDSDGYVIVDGKKTEYKVHTADNISVDDDGYLTVNGVKTEHRVDNKEYVITVNSDGYVVVNDVVTKYNVVEFECQHIFDTETVEATCTEAGYEVRTCQYCNIKTVNNKVDALGHDFSKAYNVDGDYHWYDCPRCDEILNKGYHIADDNGCCTTCGIPLSSTPGVIYDIPADGTYAEVMTYTGTATKVRIAAEYEGLPVKNIYSEAFKDNKSITSVVIPDSVVGLGDWAFYGCTSLTSVTIGNSVTSIGDSAFYKCTSLTSVTIPNSVTSIGSYAFAYCDSLTSVTIPDSVTSIGYSAFHNCNSNLYSEYECGTYVGDEDNPYAVLIGLTYNNLSTYKINEATKHIAYGVFNDCKRLTSITIPDSVTSIGSRAFAGCDSLTSVTIGNSVTSIGDYAFAGCDSLTSVTIPNSVTSIGDRAFYNCTSLTSVTIPNSVTSIGSYAFSSCSGITSVTIGNSVTSIGERAFYSCTSLTSVTIPDSVTSIGDNAFIYCSSLTSIKYRGTQAEWHAISKGERWDVNTGNYTITYNYTEE